MITLVLLIFSVQNLDVRMLTLDAVDDQFSLGNLTRTAFLRRDDFFIASPYSVYHWGNGGTLFRKLKLPDLDVIFSIFPIENTLVVQYLKNDEYYTVFINEDDEILGSLTGYEYVFYHFFHLNDKKIGLNALHSKDLAQKPYPYLLMEAEFYYNEQDVGLRTFGDFCKIIDLQRDFGFSYLRVWIGEQDNARYVMNTLESKVYVFDDEGMNRERLDGNLQPTENDFIELDLKGFVSNNKRHIIKKPMAIPEYRAKRNSWNNSWSRVRGFSDISSGFQVLYDVPDCVGEDCKPKKTYLQFFDEGFQKVGAPIDELGYYLGEWDGKHYFVYLPAINIRYQAGEQIVLKVIDENELPFYKRD